MTQKDYERLVDLRDEAKNSIDALFDDLVAKLEKEEQDRIEAEDALENLQSKAA